MMSHFHLFIEQEDRSLDLIRKASYQVGLRKIWNQMWRVKILGMTNRISYIG
jgi:hypothetical protein